MDTWAEIYEGVVRHTFQVEDGFVPEFAPPIHAVKVLGAIPKEGDSWDGTSFGPPTPPDPAVLMVALVDAVQKHLDAKARERNYDGILSLCTYATSTVPKFRAEGQAGVEWRDACWAHCYQVLANVQGALRAIPSPEELVGELPEMSWGA